MTPVHISADFNPLRLPSDRRLNRIAGPSGLVIFGVTGDLSRKKLMPAVYDLANRGLLPPGFALVGFARRDWEDQDFDGGVARQFKVSWTVPGTQRTGPVFIRIGIFAAGWSGLRQWNNGAATVQITEPTSGSSPGTRAPR